jgi:hypothetical protein
MKRIPGCTGFVHITVSRRVKGDHFWTLKGIITELGLSARLVQIEQVSKFNYKPKAEQATDIFPAPKYSIHQEVIG